MNRRSQLSVMETIGEVMRELVSIMLALLLVIPAAVIWITDRVVMVIVRRRGGLD